MAIRPIPLMFAAMLMGCSHRPSPTPGPTPYHDDSDGPTPATFMATYEVVGVKDVQNSYSRKEYEIQRHSTDPRDDPKRTILAVKLTPWIDPEFEQSLTIGAKVNVIVLPD